MDRSSLEQTLLGKRMKARIGQPYRERCWQTITGFALTLTACLSIAAIDTPDSRQHSPAIDQKDPQHALQDLVRAEAALALTQLQKREMPESYPKAGTSNQRIHNEVRSIFGVGSHLYAELVLSSKPYLFVSGQAKPVEGPDRQWKLQRIQPPCIHLSHEGRPTVLCIGAIIE